MTKKQLIEALAPYPDDMDVMLPERRTNFGYGMINSVYTEKVPFLEDEDDEVTDETPIEECIILDED